MTTYGPLSVARDDRDDPQDTDPKAGGYEKPGTGKDTGKDDPQDTDPKAGGYQKKGR